MPDTFDSPAPEGAQETTTVSSAPPSFDDLPGEESKPESNEPKETKESGEKKIPDPTGNVEEKKPAKEKEEPSKKEAAPEAKDEREIPETQEVKDIKKLLEVMDGENRLQLNRELKIPTKVDGEIQEPTLDELRANYSGKIAWDKRFTAIDRKEKQYESEKQGLIDHLSKSKEFLEKGDARGCISHLLDLVKVDKHNFNIALRNQLLPEIEEYLGLTDEEKQAFDEKSENQALKEKLQQVETERTNEQSLRELRDQVNETMTRFQVDEDDFVEASYKLQELAQNQQDGLKPEMLTPQFVCEYIKASEAVQQIAEVSNEIKPDFLNDQEAYTTLLDVATEQSIKGTPLTRDEIKALIMDDPGLSEEQVRELNEKTTESIPTKRGEKVKKSNKPELFDDYEEDVQYY